MTREFGRGERELGNTSLPSYPLQENTDPPIANRSIARPSDLTIVNTTGSGDHPERTSSTPSAVSVSRNLISSLTYRMTTVHETWKEEHGYRGQSWNKIIMKPEMQKGENIDLVPGDLDFEEQWHTGTMLGGQEFSLRNLLRSLDEWGEELARLQDNKTVEERYDDSLKILTLSTRRSGNHEDWTIYFTPDSPPFAVNNADALYLGYLTEDPRAVNHIKETFGEEAVPVLNEAEMALLTSAILNTPAKIARI